MGVASKRSIFRSGCCVDFMCRGDKCHPSKGTSMKEEWLFPNAIIPVNVETTQALVVEIKRLIDVVGGMALECPNCEYHRKRAQRWREEAYKQSGYPLPERGWVGLSQENFLEACEIAERGNYLVAFQRIQQWLKERNE